MANIVIANNDGSSAVTLNGLHTPWPSNPQISYERAGESRRAIAGWSGGSILPGEMVHFDMGFSGSCGTVELKFMANSTIKSSLDVKYAAATPLRLTLSDGSTYQVKWGSGRSWDPQPQPGFDGNGTYEAYTCTASFQVIKKL